MIELYFKLKAIEAVIGLMLAIPLIIFWIIVIIILRKSEDKDD